MFGQPGLRNVEDPLPATSVSSTVALDLACNFYAELVPCNLLRGFHFANVFESFFTSYLF